MGAQLYCPTPAGKQGQTFSERPLARGHDHGWIQDMVEHVLPASKQHDPKRTAQLVEVLFAGGKFVVSDPLIEPVSQI